MVRDREAVVITNAVFSDDEKHRFILSKIWNDRKKSAAIIMINPSYADEIKIDYSVMKIGNFLSDNDYGSFKVVNLFSYISTNPEGLVNNNDLTRIETDSYIQEALKGADTIIIARGSDEKKYVPRKKKLMNILQSYESKLMCFKDKDNKKGRHPSRLGNDLELCNFV